VGLAKSERVKKKEKRWGREINSIFHISHAVKTAETLQMGLLI
jgi:hypothetical protein